MARKTTPLSDEVTVRNSNGHFEELPAFEDACLECKGKGVRVPSGWVSLDCPF